MAVVGTGRAGNLTGYPYHLSRCSGERMVFCLDGSSPVGEGLTVETVTGEIVAEVPIEASSGETNELSRAWEKGFRFPLRAALDLHPALPSGVYLLGGRISFVHRRRSGARVAVLLPSNTAVAFNSAGGRSLYPTEGRPPADVLSFHRPLTPELLMNGCMPFVEWFAHANPYAEETTYLIDSDLEDSNALDGIEVLLVVGRSEYWTRAARENFDVFVGGGGRALLLCSEVMHWQVRLDSAGHRLFRYLHVDPHPDPLLRTTVWHHPSLEYPIYPRTGCELWYGGSGAVADGVGWDGMRIVSPGSPLLTGSSLDADEVIWLPDTTEWDGAPIDDTGVGMRVDFGDSPPWCHEVIGYNLVRPAVDGAAGNPATSLWVALRHTPNSGTVVHGGSMAWCGLRATGGQGHDSEKVRAIVLQMLTLLYEDTWPFSFSSPDSAYQRASSDPGSRLSTRSANTAAERR